MSIAREEIFGPVLSTMTFRTREEAVALANDSEFDLTASVWSRDLQNAMQTIRQVQAGRCWINVNAIAPGYIETNNTAGPREDTTRSAQILDRVPAGRWGKPEDIGAGGDFAPPRECLYPQGKTGKGQALKRNLPMNRGVSGLGDLCDQS